jgi:LCP family protein required for cell wall assembly
VIRKNGDYKEEMIETKENELEASQLNRELLTYMGMSAEQKKKKRQENVNATRQKNRPEEQTEDFVENPKKTRKKIRPVTVVLGLCAIILVAVVGVMGSFIILNNQGETQLKQNRSPEVIAVPAGVKNDNDGKVILYNGEQYCYNEDNINILFMGIDTSIDETSEEDIGGNGQADTLILASLDSKTGKFSLVNISRDAMVDINLYDTAGEYRGTKEMQICLSYAYGDGKETSCENTLESVSRLLYGMPINAYVAIDYDAISLLNDAIGGVTVEALEDINSVGIKAGETVTLSGEQAHAYVRSRDTSLLDSNNYRMERQKQYLNAFIQKAISEIKGDVTRSLDLYNAATGYMVTDLSTSEVTHLASLVVMNGVVGGDMRTVPGEVVEGEKYAEFIPDDEALYELILDVFYNKVSNSE